MKKITLMLSAILLTACVAAPKSKYDNRNDCVLKTPKWELEYSQLNGGCGMDLLGCVAIFGAVIPAVSTVVSGSIVLIGNSVHWLEYQGKCSEEEITTGLDEYKEATQQKVDEIAPK